MNWAIHNRIFNQHMSAYEDDVLHCACSNGHTETALDLIDLDADIDAENDYGETPLHYACLNDHTDIALELIDLGADIEAKEKDDQTPLYVAYDHGHEEIALALIARGADIFSKDRFGRTFDHFPPRILPRVYERLHVSTVRAHLIHQ